MMCVLPDVGHQRVPVEFRLGVVGRGRWIQRVISLCTDTETQRHRHTGEEGLETSKRKNRGRERTTADAPPPL